MFCNVTTWNSHRIISARDGFWRLYARAQERERQSERERGGRGRDGGREINEPCILFLLQCSTSRGMHYKGARNLLLKGWTRRTMLRDAWTNDGGKGWWRWWSRLGGLLAMAAAISCLVAPFPGASANPEAKRLYDDLLSNYNRLIRPVGNNSDRLTVKMGLRLSQLIDVVSRPHLTHYAAWIAFTLYRSGCILLLEPRMHIRYVEQEYLIWNSTTCFIDWLLRRNDIRRERTFILF